MQFIWLIGLARRNCRYEARQSFRPLTFGSRQVRRDEARGPALTFCRANKKSMFACVLEIDNLLLLNATRARGNRVDHRLPDVRSAAIDQRDGSAPAAGLMVAGFSCKQNPGDAAARDDIPNRLGLPACRETRHAARVRYAAGRHNCIVKHDVATYVRTIVAGSTTRSKVS